MIKRISLLSYFALLFAFNAIILAESPATAPTQAEDLQITLDLDGQPAQGLLDFVTGYRVVMTNTGKAPVQIWNPYELPGRNQWTLQFKSPGAKPIIVRRRDLKDENEAPTREVREEALGKIITLLPGRKFYMSVFLCDMTSSLAGQQELAWQGLPNPESPGEVQFSMTYESPASPEAMASHVWTGRVTTPKVKLRLFAHRLLTPHRLLRYHFHDAALEMLQQNPAKWNSTRDEEQRLPLHLAVVDSDVKMVEWLIQNGAAETTFAVDDFKPLEFAQRPEIVKALLKCKPDLNGAAGDALLRQAAQNVAQASSDESKTQRLEIVELLRSAGAKETLQTAIYLDDMESAKRFIKAYLKDDQHEKPAAALRLAIEQGRTEICKLLLEIPGIDVNHSEGGDSNPLMMGALKYPAIVRLLIEHQVNVRKRTNGNGGRFGGGRVKSDSTLLHHAADRGVPETIKLLIDNGVDIFAAAYDNHGDDEQPQTALQVASAAGRGDNVLAIIEHPKFKAAPDVVRWEALNECLITLSTSAADQEGDLRKWLTTLAAAGADVRRRGGEAVQSAALRMHPARSSKENRRCREAITILKELGAEIDFSTAVICGDEALIEALLTKSPKLAKEISKKGLPALHLAVRMNYPKIVELLLKFGCDLEIANESQSIETKGETALACAALLGRVQIAKLLIHSGANVNAANATGRTPLFEAIRMNNLKLARLLLENGAKINIKDKQGETPLDLVSDKQVTDLFEEFQNQHPKPPTKP